MMRRRNLFVGDTAWELARKAAARESLRGDKDVSVSEWIRKAVEEKLARDAAPPKVALPMKSRAE